MWLGREERECEGNERQGSIPVLENWSFVPPVLPASCAALRGTANFSEPPHLTLSCKFENYMQQVCDSTLRTVALKRLQGLLITFKYYKVRVYEDFPKYVSMCVRERKWRKEKVR